MRIVNNKIFMVKGETPTYEVDVIDEQSGAPFVIIGKYDMNNTFYGIYHPVIEFVVKPSVYSTKDEYALKFYLSYEDEVKFSTNKPESYNKLDVSSVKVWDNGVVPPLDKQAKLVDGKLVNACLYGLTQYGKTEYRYFNPNAENDGTDDYKWVPYNFKISFNFPYADGFTEENKYGFGGTSDLDIKTYRYDITLFDALIVEKDDEFVLTDIAYKKPIVELEDFVIGGSLSE